MANNPQSSGAQSLRPPAVGSMGPQSYGQPFPMQFRPGIPAQQGQPFMPSASASHQFRPVGQGVPSGNVGIPSSQSQPPHFSQPMQQLPLRPGQPSSQAIPMSYITSPQSQQTAPLLNNHIPGLGGQGAPISSSYTFAPSPFGNASSQYQLSSQMHAPVVPVGGQPWLSGGQGGPLINPLQQSGQQPSVASAVPAVNVQQSSSDWQEHSSQDGRKYYYNKNTKQSSWEKPLELMTPIEMSWQVRRN